jgi:hypothetical protein
MFNSKKYGYLRISSKLQEANSSLEYQIIDLDYRKSILIKVNEIKNAIIQLLNELVKNKIIQNEMEMILKSEKKRRLVDPKLHYF